MCKEKEINLFENGEILKGGYCPECEKKVSVKVLYDTFEVGQYDVTIDGYRTICNECGNHYASHPIVEKANLTKAKLTKDKQDGKTTAVDIINYIADNNITTDTLAKRLGMECSRLATILENLDYMSDEERKVIDNIIKNTK